MKLIFLITLLTLLYTWGGYLFLLFIFSRFIQIRLRKNEIHPHVTVLVTVHNEEQSIEKRIKNLFEIDYPKGLSEILIVSDGSTDKTNDIVDSISKEDGQIKLFKTEGGGKSSAQNKAIPYAKGEIIVLTDANTLFNKDAVKNLIKNFADEKVGCVSGKLILMNENNVIAESQGFYWKYEILLRRLESKIGIFHTASGQILAFRKRLFRPFECKYGDDCIIPLDILLQGHKVIHEDNAIAYDSFPSTIKAEFKARIRMTLRNITCTISKYPLLNPFRFPMFSISILSHKILRWLTPYCMIVFFVANFFLLNEGYFYRITFCCQLGFYFLGVAGFIAEKNNFRLLIASQVFSFILANAGFFFGVLKAILGQKIAIYRN